jgi:branched-subunit amino acid ABC-type transport system permease component
MAVVAGVALGAVLGMVTQVIAVGLLRRAAPLSKLIATLDILIILQAAISLIWAMPAVGSQRPHVTGSV